MNVIELDRLTAEARHARRYLKSRMESGCPEVLVVGDGIRRHLRLHRDKRGFYVRVGKRGRHREYLHYARRIDLLGRDASPDAMRFMFSYEQDAL